MELYYFLWNKFYLILSYNLYESKISEYFIANIFFRNINGKGKGNIYSKKQFVCDKGAK